MYTKSLGQRPDFFRGKMAVLLLLTKFNDS